MSKQYIRTVLLLSTLSHHYGAHNLLSRFIHLLISVGANWTTSIIFSVVMTTTSPQSYNVAEVPPFDTNLQLVGVDNRCSVCITNVRSDIPGEIVACNRSIRGFGGTKVWNAWMGTINWDIEDDEGVANRNMSKSKGWTLQSSLLTLWMEKTRVNNQTKLKTM